MLGIVDWGIGGISLYKLIKADRINASVIYFSDTGVTPYGKMSRSELISRLNHVVRSLKGRGVTHLMIGCNAASTALPFLDRSGLVIEGVIEPAAAVTARLNPTRLGLIGGRRTVVSGVYRKAFAAKGIGVTQRIAQPLSGLIESGDVGSETLRSEARRILKPIRNSSHILLACTHYPAIIPVLKEMVSPPTQFIDPAAEMVKIAASWKLKGGQGDQFLTSGDPQQMKAAARNAFDVVITSARNVTI